MLASWGTLLPMDEQTVPIASRRAVALGLSRSMTDDVAVMSIPRPYRGDHCDVLVDADVVNRVLGYPWAVVANGAREEVRAQVYVEREDGQGTRRSTLLLHRMVVDAARGQVVVSTVGDLTDCRRASLRVLEGGEARVDRLKTLAPYETTVKGLWFIPHRGLFRLDVPPSARWPQGRQVLFESEAAAVHHLPALARGESPTLPMVSRNRSFRGLLRAMRRDGRPEAAEELQRVWRVYQGQEAPCEVDRLDELYRLAFGAPTQRVAPRVAAYLEALRDARLRSTTTPRMPGQAPGEASIVVPPEMITGSLVRALGAAPAMTQSETEEPTEWTQEDSTSASTT